MDLEPTVGRFDVLTSSEATSSEIRAGAERRLAVGIGRSHHKIGSAVKGVPHLDKRIRLALTQPNVERLL